MSPFRDYWWWGQQWTLCSPVWGRVRLLCPQGSQSAHHWPTLCVSWELGMDNWTKVKNLPQTGLNVPLFNGPGSATTQAHIKDSLWKESNEVFSWGWAVDNAVLRQNNVFVPANAFFHQTEDTLDAIGILFYILFSVVGSKTREEELWVSKVERNYHHLMWSVVKFHPPTLF